MKILYFTKYSRQGASSRLRSYQYIPYLEKLGYDVTVQNLFDDDYLKNLYANRKQHFHVLKRYLKRLFFLPNVFKNDVVIIEKELFPYLPAFFELLFHYFNVKYIADYDDAIFHNYDQHSNPMVKKILGKKIDNVMKYSSSVFAGNSYLQERAENAGCSSIINIPTVIDLNRYLYIDKNHVSQKTTDLVTIGWIGSPSTFKYVESILEVFEKLSKRYNIKIHIVGALKKTDTSYQMEFIKWEEEKEVSLIKNFDIGIMPLADSLWEKGKCSYKLIQYMACGKPVVASPVGMNNEVIKDGENGYLAVTTIEWFDYLEKLILSSDLRSIMGKKGIIQVKEKFNIQSTLPIINQEFKRLNH